MATNIPLRGEIEVTATFKEINLSLWKDCHKGIDLIGDTVVYSPCEGIVRVSGYDAYRWGYYVSIGDSEDGTKRHILAHLKKGSIKVVPGQRVTRNTIIGDIGATGNATSVHLHYELRDTTHYKTGLPIDPSIWMGFENKRGKYKTQDYPARTWRQIHESTIATDSVNDYKAKYQAELKAHAITKANLANAYVRIAAAKSALG